MSFWNLLTSAPKAIDTTLDLVEKAGSGIDMLFYTKEEQAIASADQIAAATRAKEKSFDQWLEANKVIQNENTARSLTRRALALLIMRSFVFLLLFAVGVFHWFPDWAEFALKVATETSLGLLTLGVGGLYFGSHAISSVRGK